MKSKLLPLVLFAVLITTSAPGNAKPSIDRTKIANGPSVTKIARPKPISQWQFVNANNDLGNPHTQKAEGDWNKIAIVSKPYRDSGSTVKPFAQWTLENIKRDLGNSYTSKNAVDWNLLAILTKPYR
jgi:uncharacterized protein (UPF0261 family)